MARIPVSMTIEEEVYSQFKIYCVNNGKKVNNEVEEFMRKEIGKKK